jgi:L-ribulose-5-phosphate 3-epimerase
LPPMADRLTACTNTYHSYSLEEALDGIARAGFTSVELTSVPGWTEHVRREADDDEIQRVKNLLAQYRLTAVSFAGHSDLVSDEGVAEFRKALNIARKLGITKVTTSTGGHADTSSGSLDEQRNAFLDRIRPLADEAAQDGIDICLETHGGLLATGQISKALIEEIGKPNIGINYDPGNVIHYGDVRPEQDLPGAADKVIHMHVKDQIGGAGVWNFPTVGTGEVDFASLFKTLDEAGFDGPCSVEIEFQGEPWPALADVDKAMADSYSYVRQFVPEG